MIAPEIVARPAAVAQWHDSPRPRSVLSPLRRIEEHPGEAILYGSFIIAAIIPGINYPTTSAVSMAVFCLVAILSGIFAMFGLRHSPDGRYAVRGDVDLMEESGETTYPMDVSIWQDGVLTGSDRGVCWFEENRIAFNGHRMSFALGRQDVKGHVDLREVAQTFLYRITLDVEGRKVQIVLRPLLAPLGTTLVNYAYFQNDVRRFSNLTVGAAERCLPPLAVDPSMRPPGVLWTLPLFGAAAWFTRFMLANAVIQMGIWGWLVVVGWVAAGGLGIWRRVKFQRIRKLPQVEVET